MKKYILIAVLLFTSFISVVIFYYKFDPSLLTRLSFYINLANPYMRIVRINEGLRKEEVAEVLQDKLDWDEQEKEDFINQKDSANVEGHYFPKTYLIYKDENPSVVRATMFNEFNKQTSTVKKPKSKQIINESTALKIASIIQREASGKGDMNLISGIIWNRIFSGMRLQIDATLQYAKGSEEDGWWGQVTAQDKNIKSSYNTYLYVGLPPGPIANPGLAAISAAYNPQKTDCLFYLHDKKGKIHCSKTYEEHKKNIDLYLK